MIHNYKYSLGIYVNDWGYMAGSEGNPHVFLGLKKEKIKCNNTQIKMQEDLYQHYLKYNMLCQYYISIESNLKYIYVIPKNKAINAS